MLDDARRPRSSTAAPVVDSRNVLPVRVLLAEDNVVNQRVAIGLLTKRGHHVTAAVNGIEALAALEHEAFDIVLMDVQMPEMGGLEATAAIRERERRTGGHVRIVAMTAHAMKGDQERCLAAGMDGYLSKPVDRVQLFAEVERGSTAPAIAAHNPDDRPFQWTEMLERLGDDVPLAREVLALFLEDCPKQLLAIKTAIGNGDARQLYIVSHTLKGAAGNLTARSVAKAAHALELLGRDGLVSAAAGAWPHLEREANQFLTALRAIEAQFAIESRNAPVAPIGRVLQASPTATAATPAGPRPDGVGRRVLGILLAEDNVVNQRVAVGLLSARGHTVTVVNNGAEALAALAEATFDLVLMDVQMPVMGGLEATAEIRRRERASGRRVRIVAMTTHAMRGDRDRCLAAGMDGFLTKPIDPVTLFTTVESEIGALVLVPAAPERRGAPIDREALMRRLNGDRSLFVQVGDLFLDECPKHLAEIDRSVEASDIDQVLFAAHALKGVAGTLSAAGLVHAAIAIEACCADNRLSGLRAAADLAISEGHRVMADLREQLGETVVTPVPVAC